MTEIRLEKIEDFPPQTQAFLRDNGFSRLDQFTPMETRIALFAAAQEWAKSVPPEGEFAKEIELRILKGISDELSLHGHGLAAARVERRIHLLQLPQPRSE